MKKNIVYYVIVTVVSLAIGFFGGKMSSGQDGKSQFGQFPGQTGDRQMAEQLKGKIGGPNSNAPMSGEIISMDDKSITIKLTDGGSKIIFLSDTTSIGKMTEGTIADLEVGKKITTSGTANNDGSITAKSIQILQNFTGQQDQAVPTTPPNSAAPAEGTSADAQPLTP